MANAEQKRWVANVVNWYEAIGYEQGELNGYHMQIHHVVGRKGKHNKVAIGEWFILPLPFRLHDVSSGSELNVTHYRHRFTDAFGLQSELFKEMIESMAESGITLPFGQDIINAIMDTRK